jgi:hypothetical protein
MSAKVLSSMPAGPCSDAEVTKMTQVSKLRTRRWTAFRGWLQAVQRRQTLNLGYDRDSTSVAAAEEHLLIRGYTDR